jgi:hypothetical protein
MRDGRNLSEIQARREYGKQQKPQKSTHSRKVEGAMLSDGRERVNLLRSHNFKKKSERNRADRSDSVVQCRS